MNLFRQLVVQSEEKLKDREVFSGVTHPVSGGLRVSSKRGKNPSVVDLYFHHVYSRSIKPPQVVSRTVEAALQRTWTYRLLEMHQTTASRAPWIRHSIQVRFLYDDYGATV